jgi:hypothetical protein
MIVTNTKKLLSESFGKTRVRIMYMPLNDGVFRDSSHK